MRLVSVLLTAAFATWGCQRSSSPDPAEAVPGDSRPAAATASTEPVFVDVTVASGIDFVHNTGAFGRKWLPETMGSGVLVFDANGDGLLDLLFLNGTAFEGQPGKRTPQGFYRNLGGLKFEEATEAVGLALSAYCLGGAAGDLDNDGDADLYLSCLGTDHLFWNEGGSFREAGPEAGLTDEYEFGVSTALLDADHDGLLDIYATRYVTWTPETDLFCTLDGEAKSYCTPESYPGASPRFYCNEGGGRFSDRTEEAGLSAPDAKSLGVAVLDLDGDGWSDLAVANDTQPNLLYRNRGDGSFEELGVPSGMAFSETGVARGGMGIDAADYDRSGLPSLVIGNFANEMVALYHNEGNLLFVDTAPVSELGRETLLSLTFATFFFDYDLDSWLDLLIANGHLDADVERVQPNVKYDQPTQLFRNTGGGYREVTTSAGGDLARPRVARGAVWADLDRDGDPDLVLTTNGGRPAVFDNRQGEGHHWLGLELQGTRSNRDGLGARVTVTAGDSSQSWLVRAGGSYLSQSQVSPLFGLGPHTEADVRVEWPSGTVQTADALPADRVHNLTEPKP
ncbi:MAG: CRTAC1 family protein [Thermoanaerobaculia bacterium]